MGLSILYELNRVCQITISSKNNRSSLSKTSIVLIVFHSFICSMVTISHATFDDLPGIWAVQQAAFRPEADQLNIRETLPLLETVADLQRDFQSEIILKAVDNTGMIVGILRGKPLNSSTVRIERLAVNPQSQGLGIGRKLIQSFESEFPGKIFELEVSDTLLQNRRFYERFGYVATGDRSEDNGIPLLMMRKTPT
jgi:ribosomal protein S18 acetylase RimI-like enzyme